MASTIQLQRTIALTQQFVRNAPLTFSGNTDPALANADWVRQFMLAAPFAWRWNRNVLATPITTIPGVQDYKIALADFGWIEKATFTNLQESDQPSRELEVSLILGDNLQRGEPTHISAQLDDDAGNITFRLMPVPDVAYKLQVIYQKAAPVFTATTQTWAPVPDYLQYLCSQGMLAKAYEYLGDERFPIAMQLFLRQTIAANGGLDATQVDIFIADRMNAQREAQDIQGNSQLARQGRGAY